jgi:hypothetical protein
MIVLLALLGAVSAFCPLCWPRKLQTYVYTCRHASAYTSAHTYIHTFTYVATRTCMRLCVLVSFGGIAFLCQQAYHAVDPCRFRASLSSPDGVTRVIRTYLCCRSQESLRVLKKASRLPGKEQEPSCASKHTGNNSQTCLRYAANM